MKSSNSSSNQNLEHKALKDLCMISDDWEKNSYHFKM